MSSLIQDAGLYWRPLGGNNIDQISGHSYQYTCVLHKNEKIKISTIIVDIGKFDNHQAFGIKNSIAAVPDVRDIIQNKDLNLKAVFVTHSHPDHLNGIIHYVRAGYKLPPIYGGRYTKMILEDLYKYYQIGKINQPTFIEIEEGQIIKCSDIEVEVISASHTCFDSFGFIISACDTKVYHTGDMKIDPTTYFRKPTNLKRLKELGLNIDYIVGDFYSIDCDGFAWREADVLKTLVKIMKKSRKSKIFLPVYPTHVEMYIVAFLSALKMKKDVIFYGNADFYSYLKQIKDYGIDFCKISKGIIKVIEGVPEDIDAFSKNFVVIGAYNDIGEWFNDSKEDSFAIITAQTFFNPLKGQMNARNIKFVTLADYPVLQGAGHGHLGDWEQILKILPSAVYIPTHCPYFIAEGFRELAKKLGFEMIEPLPKNNFMYRFKGKEYTEVSAKPATWLIVNSDAIFTEVWQKATSGIGYLKRTISKKRAQRKFKMMLCQRVKNR